MSIIINFTLANSHITNEVLLEYILKENIPAEIYKLTPPKGKNVSASTDWKAVVSTVADGLTILTSLWTFYTQVVKPSKIEDSNEGVYISIQVNNNVNNIWIGNEVNSKEKLTTIYNDSINSQKIDFSEKQETIDSTIWKKIK